MSDQSNGDSHGPTGLVFGAAAEAYEQYRLGYSAEIGEAVLTFAERTVRAALEIGAGTGKATRLFASRGVHVTAVEPDRDMAAVLSRSTRDLPVQAVVATFEDFHPECRFDLLFSAAAWHWTDRETRWARAVEMLRSGGTLALFGVPGDLVDPRLAQAVEGVEREFLRPESDHPGDEWSIADITRTDGLADVKELRLPHSFVSSAEDYVGGLATVSSYLDLKASTRAEALHAVRAALPEHVLVDATAHLVLARRR